MKGTVPSLLLPKDFPAPDLAYMILHRSNQDKNENYTNLRTAVEGKIKIVNQYRSDSGVT